MIPTRPPRFPSCLSVLLTGVMSLAMPGLTAAAETRRICYLSMNNDQEFAAFQKQYQNVPDLEIVELMPVVGRDPLQSLKDGIDKLRSTNPAHPDCDGLVLSGHHNGEWFGARTNGGLELSALEDLKCDPRYQPFFDGISALWMQGCNTMDEDTGAPIVAPTAAVRSPSGGPPQHRSRADSNVSERYSALFENSTQYGWQGIAPGVGSDSPDSMILFMEGFVRDPEDQDALVNALKSSSRFSGASSSDIAAALPEIFGECRDPQAAWENPQEARYGRASNPRMSEDYRRPKASLPLSSTPNKRAPVCAIKNQSLPTPQVLAAMGASDQNLEASLPALTEELKQVMALPPDAIINVKDEKGVTVPMKRDTYIRKWREALRSDGKAIAYLKEKAHSPGTPPADRIEALKMLETLTGATMPTSDQQAVSLALDQGLQRKGDATTAEDLLEQLRLVDIAEKQGLMTPARWEQLETSLAGVPVSSNPALREIASRGVAKLMEKGGIPKAQLPARLQPLATAPGRAVTAPPTPSSAPRATVDAPSSRPSIPPMTPPRAPSDSPAPAPSRRPQNPPSASTPPTPRATPTQPTPPSVRSPSCTSRPNYFFNGFTHIPDSKACINNRDMVARCGTNPLSRCPANQCRELNGCNLIAMCQSPGRPPMTQDPCVQHWQNQMHRTGLEFIDEDGPHALCKSMRGCEITLTCVTERFLEETFWPVQHYNVGFCNRRKSETECQKYKACQWVP